MKKLLNSVLTNVLNEKLHKHKWEQVADKMGRVNFTGITGNVIPNVRVKAVLEKCTSPGCTKMRAYVVDGEGRKYPMDVKEVWG